MYTKLAALILPAILYGCASAPDYRESVVQVSVYKQSEQISIGSGVLVLTVGNKLYILTAAHVVDELKVDPGLTCFVDFFGGERCRVNQIFDPNFSADVSLLQITSDREHKAVPLSKEPPKPLTDIVSAGYPLGMTLVVAQGIVNYNIANFIERSWICTAPAYSGNSGGGVFCRDTGTLIGLSTKIGVDPNREAIVPHLHIFIPICELIGWIREVQHAR